MNTTVNTLSEQLACSQLQSLLVVTGAGISRASGIPTFRGPEPGATWRVSDTTLATRGFFQQDPVEQWRWYRQRFAATREARPNTAHEALVDLEDWFFSRNRSFLLVTQNIDSLHEAAGSRSLIKIHGTADRVRCSRIGCQNGSPYGSLPRVEEDWLQFDSHPSHERIPACPECGCLLRAHVLFFDEMYTEHEDYQFHRACAAADLADCVLFVGTSFSVGITDIILQSALRRRLPAYSIDPNPALATVPGLMVLRDRAEELLPRVVDQMVTDSER